MQANWSSIPFGADEVQWAAKRRNEYPKVWNFKIPNYKAQILFSDLETDCYFFLTYFLTLLGQGGK